MQLHRKSPEPQHDDFLVGRFLIRTAVCPFSICLDLVKRLPLLVKRLPLLPLVTRPLERRVDGPLVRRVNGILNILFRYLKSLREWLPLHTLKQ